MKRALKKVSALLGASSVAAAGLVGLTAAPAAAADAPYSKGQVSGYYWPGEDGNPNWEGTYRMPDTGEEAWCASTWAPQPMYGTEWAPEEPLTMNDGSAVDPTVMQELSYIVSTASDKVINKSGKEAQDYGAAVGIIVHDWTNSGTSWEGDNVAYDPNWALDNFSSGIAPHQLGDDPTGVPAVYNQLIEDAKKYSGHWDLAIEADDADLVLGDTASFSGSLIREGDHAPIPDKEIYLTADGVDLPVTSVMTDAQGEFSFEATVTAETISVSAERNAPATEVMMRAPTQWTSDTRPQHMIMVDDHMVADSVSLTAEVPAVGTSAVDQADGDKLISWDGGTVIDTVTYDNLVVGQEYTVEGELMDKATGEATGITGETTFVAEEAIGSVDVEFSFGEGFAGKTLVAFERLYNANGDLVGSHEDLDDEEQTVVVNDEPVLGTSAVDQEDGDKHLRWDGGTVVDTVTYEGLIPGEEYTVTGELMDQATGEGTGITGETTFTAEEAAGSVDVEFTFGEGFAGKTLVAFEQLFDVDGNLIAAHEDIEDEAQTVYVVEQPVIGTSLVDKADGDSQVAWDGGTVVDTVTYEGLIPGEEYTLIGELMDKATGEATEITGEATFTPEEPAGSVDVEFSFGEGFAGKTLVAFEQLYDAGGLLVASHEDIDDEAQTVYVDDQPETPIVLEEPEAPVVVEDLDTPVTPVEPATSKPAELATTGVTTAGLALLGGGAIVGGTLLARRRKNLAPLDDLGDEE